MTLIIRQSQIHSHGCYTTRPIRKGTLIIEYVGLCLSYEQADDLYDDFPNTYLFGLDDGKKIIDGYGVAAFVNHSCAPNCETDQIKGKMWIIALSLIIAYRLEDGSKKTVAGVTARKPLHGLYNCCAGSVHHIFVLFALQRTGRINQTATGSQSRECAAQDGDLALLQVGEIFRLQLPFDFRIPRERAGSGTRRIQKYPVKAAAKGQLIAGIENDNRNAERS